MKDYQVMPPLTDEEYAELKADIAERGVMVPIELDQDGNVLDGHHRLKACKELGRTDYPTVVRVFDTEEAKLKHAFTLNINRRQLTIEQQKDAAFRVWEKHPEMSNRQIANIVGASLDTVNKWSGERNVQVTTIQGADGKTYPADPQSQREAIRTEIVEHPEKSDRQIARETGASHVTVAKQRDVVNNIVSVFNPSKRDADALKDPDIVNRLAENDGMNVAGAIREQRRDQLVEHLESVETREAKAIEGVYDVIVVDPPWPLQKYEHDTRPNQIGLDYPIMTLDEIKSLSLPAAGDCHVFMWTTQKFVMNGDALDVMRAWGVTPIWSFVWVKDNGVKPFNLPKSSVEFVFYGHIGSPMFVDEKDFWSHFIAKTTGHSRKPDEFYDIIRRVTAGRRLDMFNRRPIDGFDSWGKEANE